MRSEGGSDDERNLITLCRLCHTLLHERRMNGTYHHREVTRAGLAAARARGVRLGNPKGRDTFGDEARERARTQSAAVRHGKPTGGSEVPGFLHAAGDQRLGLRRGRLCDDGCLPTLGPRPFAANSALARAS
jgi:hypothetical protein